MVEDLIFVASLAPARKADPRQAVWVDRKAGKAGV